MKKNALNTRNYINQPTGYILIAALLIFVSILPIMIGRANAATLSNTYLRLNRMTPSTATSFRLVFTNITAGTNSVQVDFNGTDAGVARWGDASKAGAVAASGSQVASIATCPGETGATGIPGTLTPSVTGVVLTVSTSSTMSASTAYCVDLTFTSAVTTPNTAGEYHPTVTTRTSGTPTDSTSIALRIISNDQVSMTGTVPPTFNFVINSTTDNFLSNLSTSSVVFTGGVNITLTTNAPNGWIVWAKSNNSSSGKGALNSLTAGNYKIGNPRAIGSASQVLNTSAEEYGIGVTINTDAAGGGAVSLDAAYDGTGNKAGVLDPAIFRPVASANGTANGDIITPVGRASIAGQTPAASDYNDLVTYIGAGRF